MAYERASGRCEVCETKDIQGAYDMNHNENDPEWIIVCADCHHYSLYGEQGAESFESESLVEEPDWIPAGDGRALGQQNLDINLSPLHAEGNLKDYNPITLVVLGIIGGIGVALGAQSLVK